MKQRSRDRNVKVDSGTRASLIRRKSKRPYLPPRVEPAGSVFERTKALGGAGKDALSGSWLL